jgi:acetyl esterase/lipase
VAFIAAFGAFFRIGVAVPLSRYAASLKSEWNDESGEVVTNLSYGEGKENVYDLYIPKQLMNGKETSLILFIHGGSFTSGDKADEDMWCKYFASKGFITATANYSLMGKDENANINMINEQMLMCVESIKNECLQRGLDIKQMATSGQSAGGCLAMLYAYSHAEDSPIPVKLVFQQTGPASFHAEDWSGRDSSSETELADDDLNEIAKSASGWSGKNITAKMVADGSYRSYIDAISPMMLVNENSVPTLCAYGPKDKIVPVGIKFKLFDVFEKYNVTYDYLNFEHSGHAMLGDPEMQEKFVEMALDYCIRYFE